MSWYPVYISKKITILKVMCTQKFVDEHRSVCKVLQKAPTVRWLPQEDLFRSSSSAKSSRSHVLLCATGEDAEVQKLPAVTIKVTRTLTEFFTSFRTVAAGMRKQ
jgi:hypothetical protein